MTNHGPALALTVCLAVATPLGCPAAAQDVAAEFGLGQIDHFADEQTAQARCRGDGVVWADPKTGFYYPKFVPEYGAGATGSFSCYRQARQAGYWGFGTADALSGHAGRVFPSSCVWMVAKNGHSVCGTAGM